ncbi:uncharacterized protein LOC107819520 [Nicotiana tabacum]|uniref:Uncharacterized protein LOC107819520 n=1 Tax=Nicotiana tabacum TaxID=4097 RepID=A0A1S4CJM3_TOBAC|nr:uncharacterized protein LOC104114726 [Nicotiana tomentosiformis]XP_016501119.1 PREDICTED: uncharacterized protein LOC107819520 [Nicotiana tabacum]
MLPDISTFLEGTEKLTEELKVKEESSEDDLIQEDEPKYEELDDDDDDEEKDIDDHHEIELVDANDEDFSFICGVLTVTSPIAAEEAFDNGQIRPFFPLFNKDLLLSDIDFNNLKNRQPVHPPVNTVFVETENNNPPTTSSSPNENVEISGPYCEWSKKAVEPNTNPAEGCKKSNSTGFSKLWRFRDFIRRSNSDGRDAFVFLNPTTTSKVVKKEEDKVLEKKETSVSDEVKVNKVITQKKKKKVVKKSEAVLAHEAYMKSKARDEERRRSYLPYRPELVGFFTNVNGGLTRNVHPF